MQEVPADMVHKVRTVILSGCWKIGLWKRVGMVRVLRVVGGMVVECESGRMCDQWDMNCRPCDLTKTI